MITESLPLPFNTNMKGEGTEGRGGHRHTYTCALDIVDVQTPYARRGTSRALQGTDITALKVGSQWTLHAPGSVTAIARHQV